MLDPSALRIHLHIKQLMGYDSSTPAVVRCVVGVGGAVWVDKHRVIHYSHTAPKLSSPDAYRLGITLSQ